MSIHKRSYTAKNGKAKKSRKWYIYLRDHNGQIRDNIPAFTDKAASLELDRHLQRLVALRVAGSGPDAELARFLEGCTQALVAKLAEWGVVSGERAAAGKPLTEHMEEWRLAMEAKGDAPRHIVGFSGNLRRVITDCGWRHPTDLSLSDLNIWVTDQRRLDTRSAATINHHIRAAKAFGNWLMKEKRIFENPLRHAPLLNAKTDRRIIRRPSSVDDLSKLLAATENGKTHHKMTGPERALLYRLAVDTGFRWSELRSLKRRSFNFDSTPATVHVQARYAKDRKDDWLPLRPELAADLQAYMALFLPEARAFNMPTARGAEMLRVDLEAAGIPYNNELGRSDFHSLRHTFASLLNESNVPMTTAQKLLRHSDPKLTANIYTHVLVEAKADALARLPKIVASPEKEATAKTGTTDSAIDAPRSGQSENRNNSSQKIDWKIDWSGPDLNEY